MDGEGFFGVHKRERTSWRYYPILDSAKTDLFDYIERFPDPRMKKRVDRRDLKFSIVFKPSVESG